MRRHLWRWNFYTKKFCLTLALSLCRLHFWHFGLFFLFFFPCCDYLLPCMPFSYSAQPTMNANDRLLSSMVMPDGTHAVGASARACVCEITFFRNFVRVSDILLVLSFSFLWLVMSWNTVRLPYTMRKTWKFIGKIVCNSLSTQAIVTADSIDIRIEVVRRHYEYLYCVCVCVCALDVRVCCHLVPPFVPISRVFDVSFALSQMLDVRQFSIRIWIGNFTVVNIEQHAKLWRWKNHVNLVSTVEHHRGFVTHASDARASYILAKNEKLHPIWMSYVRLNCECNFCFCYETWYSSLVAGTFEQPPNCTQALDTRWLRHTFIYI